MASARGRVRRAVISRRREFLCSRFRRPCHHHCVKKRWFLILLGCLLFVSLVTTAWFRESEPRYKGKTAIEWAEIYESSFQPDGHNDLFARREAVDAVRHMRDQVLPLALNLISQEKPAWKDSVEHFMEFKLDVRRWCPTWVWLPFYRYPPNEGLVYFHMLGPDAGPAVPELVRVINESESLNISQRAMDALASIGAAGYPSLARIVADTQQSESSLRCLHRRRYDGPASGPL